jgi:hypothetical protein
MWFSISLTEFEASNLFFYMHRPSIYSLRDLYYKPSIIRIIKLRRMKWAGHVAGMGEKRNAYRLLVGKPEGKSPLARPRRGWVDNVRMDLGEVERGDVDWIDLTQDRNRSSCEFGIEPSGSIKFWEAVEFPNNWWPLE